MTIHFFPPENSLRSVSLRPLRDHRPPSPHTCLPSPSSLTLHPHIHPPGSYDALGTHRVLSSHSSRERWHGHASDNGVHQKTCTAEKDVQANEGYVNSPEIALEELPDYSRSVLFVWGFHENKINIRGVLCLDITSLIRGEGLGTTWYSPGGLESRSTRSTNQLKSSVRDVSLRLMTPAVRFCCVLLEETRCQRWCLYLPWAWNYTRIDALLPNRKCPRFARRWWRS